MKFNNGKRFTVMALILWVLAIYLLFTGGDLIVACTALILANLECE